MKVLIQDIFISYVKLEYSSNQFYDSLISNIPLAVNIETSLLVTLWYLWSIDGNEVTFKEVLLHLLLTNFNNPIL